MSSKLDYTDIERAAKQHLQGIEDNLHYNFREACMPHDDKMDIIDDIEYYITDAFFVGAEWGAQRIIKDMWHPYTKEPQEGKYIVFDTVSKKLVVGRFTPHNPSSGFPWKTYVEATGLYHWCYAEDLFKSINQ